MNNLFEQLKDDYRSHQMTDAEKSSIRTSLISHMGAPLSRPQKSPYSTWVRFSLRTLAFGIIGIMASGVGLTYASQDAMPGDTLYAFKVHVAEEIIERTKVSSPQRAHYAIERMARRLDEAEYLATSSSLTVEHQSDITRLAAAHARDAYDIIDDTAMRITDSERSALYTHINAEIHLHSDQLIEIIDTEPSITSLLAMADSTLQATTQEQASRELVRTSEEQLSEIKKRVETLRSNIEMSHESERTSLSPTGNIEDLLAQAEDKINEHKYFEALTLINDAEMHSDELRIQTVRSLEHITITRDTDTMNITLHDDVRSEARYELTLSPEGAFAVSRFPFSLDENQSSYSVILPLETLTKALSISTDEILLTLTHITPEGSYEVATRTLTAADVE